MAAHDPDLPPAKRPPGTWTPLETSHLIDAYQEKWYSLKRGLLRSRHWEEVAQALASRCPGLDPCKTSMQCRHKMEKLRRKYRAERQQLLRKGPGSAPWPFFEQMDLMERGPGSVSSLQQQSDAARGLFEGRKWSYLPPDPFRVSTVKRAREREREKERDRDRERELEEHESTMSLNDDGRDDSDEPPHAANHQGEDRLKDSKTPYTFLRRKREVSAVHEAYNPDHDSHRIPTKHRKPAVDMSAFSDMVSAVRWLGEGFLKVEQMKLQMQRESEHQRMEMELRRTEMVLSSQRQIAELVTRALSSSKKSKKA